MHNQPVEKPAGFAPRRPPRAGSAGRSYIDQLAILLAVKVPPIELFSVDRVYARPPDPAMLATVVWLTSDASGSRPSPVVR